MGQDNTAKNQALDASKTSSATAAGALGTLNPIYTSDAQGTNGLTDQQKADLLTASGQSLGGGVASAVGQGGLLAARTGNAGASTAALDDAARNASVQQSQNALGVQTASDALAQQNKENALSGLNSIYGTATGSQGQNTSTAVQATKQPFWQSLLQSGVQAAGAVGSAAAGKPCYIAAELYGGWDEPRTVAIRNWLVGEFSETPEGRFVVKAYILFGETIASLIQANKPMRWAFRILFDCILRKAVK